MFCLSTLLILTFAANVTADDDNISDEIKIYWKYRDASAVVAPFKEPLFTVYGSIGSISAEKRAKQISDNIITLKRDMFFKPDLLIISDESNISNVVYMGNVILGVTDHQATVLNKPRRTLALEYRQIISDAVIKERKTNIWIIVAKQSALSILVVLATVLAVKYLNKLFRFLEVYLWRKKESATKAINNIIDVKKQRLFTRYLFRIVRYTLIVVTLYSGFLFLLSIFPVTKWIADTLINYISLPLIKSLYAVWDYVPNLFAIVVILVLFRVLSKALRSIAEKIEKRSIVINNFHSDWAMPTYKVARVILIVFAFIFIFPHLPSSNSDVFKGISIFLGVLLSLGSTSIINNIVSGLVITYMRPFNIGDRIKMGEYIGEVIEKASLVTRIKTPKNEIITIPNSTIMTASTINYTASAKDFGLQLSISIGIGYDVPWRAVHELLISAGLKTAAVLREPAPVVLQTALTVSTIQYELYVYTTDADKMAFTMSELHQNVVDIFSAAGIEIMSPTVIEHRNNPSFATPKNSPQDDDGK